MRQMVVHGRWLSLPLLIGLAACGDGAGDWPVAHDLVAGAALAEARSETRSIDFGSMTARRHLVSGWSRDRWDRQRSRGYVRGMGSESVLEFDVIEPRPLILRFLVGLRDNEIDRTFEVEVLVNDFPVGVLEIGVAARRHRQAVPDGILRRGVNTMTLRYAGAVALGDLRPAWYELDLRFEGGVADPPLPFVTANGDALMLPWGSTLEYYLELPAEAALVVDPLQPVGEAGGHLQVTVEQDGQAPSERSIAVGTVERIEMALAGEETPIVRLSLSAVHPEAGLSERAGLLLTAAAIRAPVADPPVAARPAEVEPEKGPQPNILMYVVDTLRADHLGIHGYQRPVSPELDRFAGRATVFENAIGQSSWTRASMASIFTGLWPIKHAANGRKDILDPAAETLAEILSAAGYQTQALVRNWNVFPIFGFRQGFDDFNRIREGKADRVNGFVTDFLERRDPRRPFFLWVHTVDPHEPYRPSAASRRQFMEEGQEQFDLDKHPPFKSTHAMSPAERQRVARFLKSLYDAEIAGNDQAFGDLVDMLEARGLLDSTVVIFVSDHGEEFLEHGTWGHGRNLHAATLNVPLVIRFPDRGHGRRIGSNVQHIDLLPTILDYIGLEIPAVTEGRSLLPLLDSDGVTAGVRAPLAFSYLHLDGMPTRGLVDGRWKLVQRLSSEGRPTWTALYDRRQDPAERRDQSGRYPIRVRYMDLLLDAKMREGSLLTTAEAILDEETERALKALGYLQ